MDFPIDYTYTYNKRDADDWMEKDFQYDISGDDIEELIFKKLQNSGFDPETMVQYIQNYTDDELSFYGLSDDEDAAASQLSMMTPVEKSDIARDIARDASVSDKYFKENEDELHDKFAERAYQWYEDNDGNF